MGEGERMLELLQRWGSRRSEVRFFLRHERVPGREPGEFSSISSNGARHASLVR